MLLHFLLPVLHKGATILSLTRLWSLRKHHSILVHLEAAIRCRELSSHLKSFHDCFLFYHYLTQTMTLTLNKVPPNPLKTAHHQVFVKGYNCHMHHCDTEKGSKAVLELSPLSLLTG